jgi:hypothetical protein
MKTKIIFFVFLLCCTISGCSNSDNQPEEELSAINAVELEKKLSVIKTVEDEKSIFADILEVYTGGILPYDKDNKRFDFYQIDFSNDKWWQSIHTLKFFLADGDVTYQIIDPQNVFILIPESLFKSLKDW